MLLRVYGADLKPVALASAAAKGADVTLVGVADPQAQGGGGAVSIAKARVSDALALEPAPAPGFDGAAALDAQGRLAALAVLNSPVVAGTAPAPNATAALAPVEAHPHFPRCEQGRARGRCRHRHGCREGLGRPGDLRAEMSARSA